MRRSLVIAAILILIALLATGGLSLFAPFTTEDVAPQHDREPELVHPNGSDSGFYPYLNARPRFTQRSPVNIIVHGNASRVARLMQEQTPSRWNETEADEEDVGGRTLFEGENETLENGTVVNESAAANRSDVNESFVNDSNPNASEPGDPVDNDSAENDSENRSFIDELDPTTAWARTTGATRWAYVDPGPNESGVWMTETMQLHFGEYFGTRVHIRMYESPNESEEWVFMQAHKEHFDWFTLRHRVDSSEQAQSYVEQEFMGQPFVKEDGIYRIYLDNGGPSDSDGWATVIELAYLLPLLLGLGGAGLGRAARSPLHEVELERLRAVRERMTARHILLPLVVITLLLGVRFGGIYLEQNAPELSMYAIMALLYPVMAVGIPVATYLIASGIDRQFDAAVIASASLSAAIWFDYAYLGIATLPIDVVMQRIVVILALGLIAGGAARQGIREAHTRWNEMLVGGIALWIVVLVGTLLGYF